MKKLFTLLLICIYALIAKTTQAGHILGTEMTYSSTNIPGIMNLEVKVYRNCAEINLCANCPTKLSGACKIPLGLYGATAPAGSNIKENPMAGNNFYTTYLSVDTVIGVFDALPLCSLQKSICSNCGTRTPGMFTPGIEVYTFRGQIDLGSIPKANTYLGIGFSHCCRNSSNTTLYNPDMLNYYSEMTINTERYYKNSAPYFNVPPTIFVNVNDGVYTNIGAVDPDGDSLSYFLAPSLMNKNTNAPYVSPYSPTVPFPYLGAPISSPPALPPAGIFMDQTDGTLRFRPTGTFVSNLVIGIIQWRKIDGVNTIMGITRRDIQIQCVNSYDNDNPLLYSFSSTGVSHPSFKNSYTLKPNVPFCFQVSARDYPASINSLKDSTDIQVSFDKELMLSNIVVNKLYNVATRPQFDSVEICFTPSLGMRRNKPYFIHVIGSDRNCPVIGKSARSISIYVRDSNCAAQIKLLSKDSVCANANDFLFEDQSYYGNGNISRQWFFGDGTLGSNEIENHRFVNGGDYRVKLLIQNTVGCKDSAELNVHVLPVPIHETISSVAGIFVPQTPYLFSIKKYESYGYKWSVNNAFLTANNDTSSFVSFFGTGTAKVQVVVNNKFGCLDTSVRNIQIVPTNIQEIAQLGKLHISPNPNKGSFTLSTQLENAQNLHMSIVNIQGQLVWKKDSWVNAGKQQIDVNAALSNGVYFLELDNGTKQSVIKFIVQ